MSDHEFPDDYYTTVEEFLNAIDGQDFMAYYPEKRHMVCDFCSKGTPYAKGARVGQYWADRVPKAPTQWARKINRERKLAPLATYCEECTSRLLFFPCEGFTEVRVYVTLDEARVYKNPEVRDLSSADDGIPWDPAELSEQITGIPFEEHNLFTEEGNVMGPENIVTTFLALGSGIDIREMIDYEGNIDPKLLGQARKAYEAFGKKVRQEGASEDAFRRHVRGQRDDL